MVLKREDDRQAIRNCFAVLRSAIQSDTSLNRTDLGLATENFFRDLLNHVLDGGFENLNAKLGNAPAIDLVDNAKKHCIQVTATSKKQKIDETLKKFVKHGYHKKYDRLTIFITTKKSMYRGDSFTDPSGMFSISKNEDIWDWDDILKFIDNLRQDKIKNIRKFVEENINFHLNLTPQKEIATFFALMGILSDETHKQAGKGNLNEPDPEKKIKIRFAEHSNYLMKQFTRYYTEYGAVLNDAYKGVDLGSVKMRRLGLHLGTTSNKFLLKQNDNPKDALDLMVDHYLTMLKKHGKEAEDGAVRFFLLDQMIKCYVFPK